jgi:hypothetical protein
MEFTQCEECGTRIFLAGECVPAGTYLRVDDGSFQRLHLTASGELPASFDGHIARYRIAAAPCACQLRQTRDAATTIPIEITHLMVNRELV